MCEGFRCIDTVPDNKANFLISISHSPVRHKKAMNGNRSSRFINLINQYIVFDGCLVVARPFQISVLAPFIHMRIAFQIAVALFHFIKEIGSCGGVCKLNGNVRDDIIQIAVSKFRNSQPIHCIFFLCFSKRRLRPSPFLPISAPRLQPICYIRPA